MGALKITDKVYSVGVLNPNLRVFDIVMTTEYGTSYNAYVVKGSKKAALVEAVHLDFFDEYIENIKSVVDLSEIEYLIMNHTEPDHSGAIKKLIELIPNLKIVTSQAGALYLKNIINRTDCYITVKNDEALSLGDESLVFKTAPFLHWPDSMFTYFADEKIAFTCDFLGSHYCQPTVLDTKLQAQYRAAYEYALLNYYRAIFGPFKPYVIKGLDIFEQLGAEIACVSHGPVLTKDGILPHVLSKYREWSAPISRENKLIPIFYCSAYQNTQHIAFAIARGISKKLPTADVCCYNLNFVDMADMAGLINDCDGFLIGSPTINRDAVAPVWNLLSHIDAINSAKKPVALFGSYGWSGEAFPNLRGRLEGLKSAVFAEDFKIIFTPTDEDLKNAEAFGERFAESSLSSL